MMRGWRRAAAWWRGTMRPRSGIVPLLSCESMERRALMASGPASSIVPPPNPTITVGAIDATTPRLNIVIAASPSSDLISAVKVFLRDLEITFAPGNSGVTDESLTALRTDLRNIIVLAGAEETKLASRLDADLSAFAEAGRITPFSRMRLIDDLESLVLTAGIPGQVVLNAATEAIGARTATSTDAFDQVLVDPNSLGSTRSGPRRGQDTSPPITPGSVGIVRPESGTLGRSFRSLLDDLKDILGKTPTVSPAQRTSIRNDFAAVAIRGNQPDPDLVATLRADLDAIVLDGRITNDGRAKIATDLTAMLNDAGIPPTLIDRTMNDLAPLMQTLDLPPVDLRTILNDLANVLAARPAATPRVGSWWYGGTPTGF